MVPEKIDHAFFASTKDQDLSIYLHWYVIGYLEKNQSPGDTYQREKELLAMLPMSLRANSLVCNLIGEVSNGGFSGVINNGLAYFAAEIEESLAFYGATEHLDVFQRWRRLYERMVEKHPILLRYAVVGMSGRLTDAESKLLDNCWQDSTFESEEEALTEEFYRLDEVSNIHDLLIAHCRANPSLYFHP